MTTFTVLMTYGKDTPGTYVYRQIDDNGAFVSNHDATVPSVYIKQRAFGRNLPPAIYEVIFKPLDSLPVKAKAQASAKAPQRRRAA